MDDDYKKSMQAFEAALTARPPEIPDPALQRVLLVVDGSRQDDLSAGLTGVIAGRFQVPVDVLDARPPASPDAAARTRAEALSGFGIDANPVERHPDKEPVEAIIEAAAAGPADLTVVCAPYMSELAVLGHESIGSAIEMLLWRARTPLLITRDPKPPARLFDSVLLPLTFYADENEDAAGWALKLVKPHGEIVLLLVCDTEVVGSAQHLLGDRIDASALDEEALKALELKEHNDIIAAVQHKAAEASLSCAVKVRLGEAAQVLADVGNAGDRVVVVGCPSDHQSAGYQRVLAFLRESANPVLVV